MEPTHSQLRRRAITIVNVLVAAALVVLIIGAEWLQTEGARSTAEATRAAAVGPLITFGGAGVLSYTPYTLSARVGQAVEWRGSLAEHPLISVDGLWPRQASGDSFSFTFTKPGTYAYYCQIHGGPGGGMAGTVVVE